MIAIVNTERLKSWMIRDTPKLAGRYMGYGWVARLNKDSVTIQIYDNKYLIKEVDTIGSKRSTVNFEKFAIMVIRFINTERNYS